METKKAYGKVDILVNNAGIYEFAPLETITAEHIQKLFNLNVIGLIFTTQEAAKLMGPEGGSIVNIGSIVGSMPAPQASVYSASKAAVDAISVSLSQELGPRKIHVNSLASRHGRDRRSSRIQSLSRGRFASSRNGKLLLDESLIRTTLLGPSLSLLATTLAGSLAKSLWLQRQTDVTVP